MKRVAIIEDNRDIREMYSFKLKAGGFEVLEGEDGEAGLELIRKEKPDLVLLDIMLPKKDGFDILREINAPDSGIKGLPVIVISNLSNREDFFEAKKLGAIDFLVKSECIPADVLKKVRSFFAQQ